MSHVDRFHRAFSLLQTHRRSGRPDAELLESEPHLRDILEPLIAGVETRTVLTSLDATDTGQELPINMSQALPDAVGPYRVLGELGDGGMGVVYLGEQTEPVRRLVALKLIKRGLASSRARARFDAERQALAVMSHPNVGRLYDAGETEDGSPYVAMEYVPGEPITRFCAASKLDVPARLDLFLRVCDGVHHAHQKAIIHRDLKPSNVLVTDRDGVPTPVVIDFGIAKPIGHKLVEQTFAETGQLVGTPEYMSSEQMAGRIEEIDTRTDVHALGLLLYEMLTDRHAFESATTGTASFAELEVAVREEVPRRPSALRTELRSDLDWVTLKALEKERDRRYSSVAELADDVRRVLRFEPIRARPPTTAYVLRRFLRRRRGTVAACAAVLASLVAGLIGVAIFARGENQARERYAQLSNLVYLERAILAERDLYPAHPDKLDVMRAWLRDHADPLIARLPKLEAALAEIEAEPIALGVAQAATQQAEDAEIAFLRANLTTLIADIRSFESGLVRRVRERAEWATTIEQRSILDHADRWAAARRAIASADGATASTEYGPAGTIDLPPQIGLVPIGMNPMSKLWEFVHLRSTARDADLPTIDDYGRRGVLPVDVGSGIVFVLVPGGTFTMGSQDDDPDDPNYDAASQANEQPVHPVTLAPYFVARHELTQGQWQRLHLETDPDTVDAEMPIAFRFPQTSMGWAEADATMRGNGLALPTEAQWEYACRAGTTTRWWTGPERESLIDDGVALNIADRQARRAGARWVELEDWRDLDDGWAIIGPVDTLRPNPWGLHLVCGNAQEWCLDEFLPYENDVAPATGLRLGTGNGRRICRGGSFRTIADNVRSANRDFNLPTNAVNLLGLRAVRALVLE